MIGAILRGIFFGNELMAIQQNFRGINIPEGRSTKRKQMLKLGENEGRVLTVGPNHVRVIKGRSRVYYVHRSGKVKHEIWRGLWYDSTRRK